MAVPLQLNPTVVLTFPVEKLIHLQPPGELPSLTYAVPVAAGLAGVILSFILSPFELIKVTCTLQHTTTMFACKTEGLCAACAETMH